jgi:hypothetical protein
MAARKSRRKSSSVKTVTLSDLQKLGRGSRSRSIDAASARKKYDAKWDKFEKKTLKKIDKDIKKTIKEMKRATI